MKLSLAVLTVSLINEAEKSTLVTGYGYGYTGSANQNFTDTNDLKEIFDSVGHSAKTYFTEAFELAQSIDKSRLKYCL